MYLKRFGFNQFYEHIISMFTMKNLLNDLPKQGIVVLGGYSQLVQTPATMMFGMPKAVTAIQMEDYTNKSSGLSEEIRRRQENLRFVFKQFKKDFIKAITFDTLLNRRIAKESYTSLMDIEMLNPMGLRSPLLDYCMVVLEAIEICKLIIGKTLPNAKIFFAELVANNELKNNRPLDSFQYLILNTENVDRLKGSFSKMLDSQYENPITTFGQQFKRIKDWEDTNKLCAEISKGLEDISKQNLQGEIKVISDLLDKLSLRVKREGEEDGISKSNVEAIKVATRSIAEEVSFLGAVIHLADTLINVMEDNKEFLRDYLTK